MNLNTLFSYLILFLLLSSNLCAQVTIGSNTPPVPGAILQLKESDNPGTNSTKGLLLPRVQLTGHNLDALETAVSDTPSMYVGLVVWNVRGIQDICKGVQVWTGTHWESIVPAPKDLTSYNPTTGILTDHEGNTYTTALFGAAGRWMTVNLRTKRPPNSCEDVFFAREITSTQWSNNLEMKVMMYPNSTNQPEPPSTWSEAQGMLYTWSLATNGKGGVDGRGNVDNPLGNVDEANSQPVQRQGICPNGWHLPSNSEWDQLLTVLQQDATSNADAYAQYSGRTYTVGARGGITTLKSNTPATGASQIPNGASKPAAEGGFDALFTAYGTSGGASGNYGNYADFWTASTSSTTTLAYNKIFSSSNTTFTGGSGAGQRNFLYSVRCKKNDN